MTGRLMTLTRAFQNVAEAENTSGRGDSTGER